MTRGGREHNQGQGRDWEIKRAEVAIASKR